jgi:hypothetical protein
MRHVVGGGGGDGAGGDGAETRARCVVHVGRLCRLQQPLCDPITHGLALNYNSVPKVADQVVMQVTRRNQRSIGLHNAREMPAVRDTRCLAVCTE